MATIHINGDACVIKSTMKLEDLKTIKKYRPDALVLKGGEDGKEELFRIGVSEGNPGSLNKYGATFGRVANDGSGLASVTMMIGVVPDGGVTREFVADQIGYAVNTLTKLEATLPAVVSEIAAEKAHIMESISIA